MTHWLPSTYPLTAPSFTHFLSSPPTLSLSYYLLSLTSSYLLQDKNTGDSLATFIFGADKNKADRLIDADRLELLVEGFSSYEQSVGIRSHQYTLYQYTLYQNTINTHTSLPYYLWKDSARMNNP